MYKAIKDNKIIAISDTYTEFPFMIKDSVVEDTEHTSSDYEQYNGEFILKSEVPAPTKEEQEQARASAYASEIDPLHARKARKTILGEWTEEDEAEYVAKVKELSAEIVERYPYPTDPITEGE
jgi:hypothetical protein